MTSEKSFGLVLFDLNPEDGDSIVISPIEGQSSLEMICRLLQCVANLCDAKIAGGELEQIKCASVEVAATEAAARLRRFVGCPSCKGRQECPTCWDGLGAVPCHACAGSRRCSRCGGLGCIKLPAREGRPPDEKPF